MYKKYGKRAIDFVLSFCGLIILSPVFLLIALWVKSDSSGPVFFRQRRIGKDKKEFLILWRASRAFALICVVFIAMSAVSQDNIIFLFMPIMISGLLPSTLLSYDERCKWQEFSGALPVSRAQLVSAKYLLGLGCMTVILVITVVVHLIVRRYPMEMLFALLCSIFGLALFVSAVSLPMMFKYGVEKGRLWYYATLVLVGGASGASAGVANDLFNGDLPSFLWLFPIIGAVLFALSWLLAIRFYQKREF